jgi:SOS-response transcriptional repressor LexA
MKDAKKQTSKPFTDRLRSLLGARPITAIAPKIPCTYEHVRRIFKESHVPHDNLIVPLAKAFDVNVDELRYLAAMQKTSDVVRTKIRDLEGLLTAPGGKAEEMSAIGFAIPVVGAASAKEDGEPHVEWEHQEFASEARLKGNLHAIRVRGDSLAPIALNGQLVIYDQDRQPKKGDLCVAVMAKGKHKGETFIKRYFEEGDTVVLAPCWHSGEALTAKKDEAQFYLVIGVWFSA